MRQADLEREMKELGVSRYWKKVERSTQSGMESNHPLGRRLLTESVAKLADAIKDWKHEVERHPTGNQHAAYAYIDILDPTLVAAITARTVIDCISMHKKLTKAANNVARLIEDEVRWRELKKQHPSIWRLNAPQVKKIPGYQTKRKYLQNSERYVDLQFDRWPVVHKTKVGMVLIELMRQSTGIIDIKTRTGLMGKTYTYVHGTEDLQTWMKEAHNYAEDLSPIYLPMVERPDPYRDMFRGGYRTDSVAPRPLVRTQDRAHLEDLNAMQLPEVYGCINKLQDVPWKVNPVVYDTLIHCWELGIEIGELPAGTDQLIPSKPVDIATNEEARRKWRKLKARLIFENNANQSKRLQVSKVLWMAKKFKEHSIYYPWYMCFRGRKYPRPYYLQPQGPDWSRSLLRSAKGLPLDTQSAENALAIQGANTFGEDKVSLEDRIQWTHSNRQLIQEVAEDPRGTVSVWGKADKPWAFLAFCDEWSRYLNEGKGFVTHLPCSIDGASNGLQLFSLAMRDPVGAAATNVLPCEVPNDIYGDVSDRAITQMKTDASGGHKFAQTWLKFGIDRGVAKRPTMVVPYSGTQYSCRTYVMDWFRNEIKKRNITNPFGWEEFYAPCNYLASVVWDSIDQVVGEARKAMEWLRACAAVCIEHQVAIRWTTPGSGFLIKQAYETWNQHSVRTIIGDVIRQHRIRVGTGKLCKRRALNGIAPNWVHGLDGDVSTITVYKMALQNATFINSIHDDLSVLAPEMDLLRSTLLNTVAEMFSENLLERFYEEVMTQLPVGVSLPLPPSVGTLDVNLVRDSKYFFA